MFVFCFVWTPMINEYYALFSNEPLLAETWPYDPSALTDLGSTSNHVFKHDE